MQAKLTAKTIKAFFPQHKPYEVVDSEIKGFLLRVQPSGVLSYYFSYRTAEGKRKRYCIGKHGSITPVQARDVALKLSAQVVSGADVQANKQRTRHEAEQAKGKTLQGFLEVRYGPWVKAERKTGEDTLKRIRSNFAHFLDLPLTQINTWVVEKWRAEQLKAGKAKTTINRDIAALKACLSKAVEWGLIEIHPLAKLKPVKTDKNQKVRYLTDDEEIRLRTALDAREERMRKDRDRANAWRRARGYPEFPDLRKANYTDYIKPMVLVSIHTGLRRGELFHLTWDHINFSTKTLTVVGEKAKSGNTRHIPLNTEAMNVLTGWQAQAEDSQLVFPGKDNKPLINVRKAWRTVLEDAGISDFRWHDLRHHFASKLVMAGVDLNTVRELLGHSSLTMTLRYAHLSPDHKASAVAKLIATK